MISARLAEANTFAPTTRRRTRHRRGAGGILDLLDEVAPDLASPLRAEFARVRSQTARYRLQLRAAEDRIADLRRELRGGPNEPLLSQTTNPQVT